MALYVDGLSFAAVKNAQGEFEALYRARPLLVAAAYFMAYVVMAALCVPGSLVLTLLGGALFGLFVGTVLVSFASAIGSLLAMGLSRYLLRDWLRAHWGAQLAEIDRGVEADGAFYLFTLRLVPLFPYFIVNALMGLTAMRAGTFYVVTQLGMLAGTVVYVNAGTQLARIVSPADVLSAPLLLSFTLLGLLPLLARQLVVALRARRGVTPSDGRRR